MEWGSEAFDRARTEGKPIFLSIGYSSCHWCHVMAHECFESADVAAILNESFVAIKVDREERPDVDDTYMTAVQLSTGRGGWPMSLFLTADRAPFFAGTYIPREDRNGQAGFLTICRQIASVWKDQQHDVEGSANEFAQSVSSALSSSVEPEFDALSALDIEDAFRAQLAEFDDEHGGFGGAPKFPPHSALRFLTQFSKSSFGSDVMRIKAQSMVATTLTAMRAGGIHDHVGGGYHRYSTDSQWRLPHFEKNLYDNAMMLLNLHAAGQPCADVVRWLKSEMSGEDGLLYAAIDADTEGEGEGSFYTWTLAELQAAAPALIRPAGATLEGNFEEEASRRPIGRNLLAFKPGFDGDFTPFVALRAERVPPATDRKALVGWNGLAIWALAAAGETDRARIAADALLSYDPLPRMIVDGQAFGRAFLEDYAYLIRGLLELGDTRAAKYADEMVDQFWDELGGGFWSTGSHHETLLGRQKPVFDSPLPSANAIALECLSLLGRDDFARRGLSALMGWMHRVPNATEALFSVALTYVSSEPEVETVVTQTMLPSVGDVELSVDWNSSERRGVLMLTIPEGWTVATTGDFGLTLSAEVGEVDAEIPKQFELIGTVTIPFRVPSQPMPSELIVDFQACSDHQCLLPMTRRFDLA